MKTKFTKRSLRDIIHTQIYASNQTCAGSARSQPSRLLLVNFDDVILLHLQSLGRLVVVDAPAVEEEAQRADRDAHSLAVRLLQFALY